MPQFFINKKIATGDLVSITGADARHILKSLRLRTGDWIVLSDGSGRSLRSTIISTGSALVTAQIGDEIARHQSSRPPALALSLIKGDRFETAIQKTVELGITDIIPFISERTVKKPNGLRSAVCGLQSENRIHARWAKIALEAAKQSGLPFVPNIETVITFEDLCKRMPSFDRAVLFFEGETKRTIREVFSTLHASRTKLHDLLIIGPEGGFTAYEVAFAEDSGAITVSLGVQILRVETAAITAAAIWQYELGNMGL